MHATIDGAGRLVIPKPIRERLGLRGGERLEVRQEGEEIRIVKPRRKISLVEGEHGLRVPDPEADLPGLGPDEVREELERARR
jgi:AbrB family looped-hinge helix DNA binding protein